MPVLALGEHGEFISMLWLATVIVDVEIFLSLLNNLELRLLLA